MPFYPTFGRLHMLRQGHPCHAKYDISGINPSDETTYVTIYSDKYIHFCQLSYTQFLNCLFHPGPWVVVDTCQIATVSSQISYLGPRVQHRGPLWGTCYDDLENNWKQKYLLFRDSVIIYIYCSSICHFPYIIRCRGYIIHVDDSSRCFQCLNCIIPRPLHGFYFYLYEPIYILTNPAIKSIASWWGMSFW